MIRKTPNIVYVPVYCQHLNAEVYDLDNPARKAECIDGSIMVLLHTEFVVLSDFYWLVTPVSSRSSNALALEKCSVKRR